MSLIRYCTPALNPLRSTGRLESLLGLAFPQAGTCAPWAPSLDADEDKNKFIVTLEVPGVRKEDLSVTVHENVLTVSGERQAEKDKTEITVHRRERSTGKFTRSLSLPSEVQADKVSAVYKDGVLTVEIPKAEEAKPKTVEVKVS